MSKFYNNITEKVDNYLLGEGIMDRRAKSMQADLDKKFGKQGTNLVDKVYNQLMKIPDFKRLGMDQQGEIAMTVVKMMGK